MSDPPESGSSQIVIYRTEDGNTRLEVRLEQETVWLTQQLMAELFQTTKQNIGQHLRNIFSEGELTEDSVVKKFFTTASDGKSYKTNFYNLDAIISVGYRVKSHIATRFRQWATQRLREYIVKGFVLDDERLKNPDQSFDYFDELLRRIQDIRTSEKRFYQKITDIYATSVDYDPTVPISIDFFKTVQNKLHWAITGKPARRMRMIFSNWRRSWKSRGRPTREGLPAQPEIMLQHALPFTPSEKENELGDRTENGRARGQSGRIRHCSFAAAVSPPFGRRPYQSGDLEHLPFLGS